MCLDYMFMGNAKKLTHAHTHTHTHAYKSPAPVSGHEGIDENTRYYED